MSLGRIVRFRVCTIWNILFLFFAADLEFCSGAFCMGVRASFPLSASPYTSPLVLLFATWAQANITLYRRLSAAQYVSTCPSLRSRYDYYSSNAYFHLGHGVKGFRNSPYGERRIGALTAIKARAPVLGGNFGVWGGEEPNSV